MTLEVNADGMFWILTLATDPVALKPLTGDPYTNHIGWKGKQNVYLVNTDWTKLTPEDSISSFVEI